jgi:hypothetical protein
MASSSQYQLGLRCKHNDPTTEREAHHPLSVADPANDAAIFAQLHKVFAGDMDAEDALMSEEEIAEEYVKQFIVFNCWKMLIAGRCNAAVAREIAFRNFRIISGGGVEFLVDGVLAISTCGVFEDVAGNEKVSEWMKSDAHL